MAASSTYRRHGGLAGLISAGVLTVAAGTYGIAEHGGPGRPVDRQQPSGSARGPTQGSLHSVVSRPSENSGSGGAVSTSPTVPTPPSASYPAGDIGACCLSDHGCRVLSLSACQADGGVYQGNDTICTGVGACCLADDTCLPADGVCCENQLGGHRVLRPCAGRMRRAVRRTAGAR